MSTYHIDGDYTTEKQVGNIEYWRDEFTRATMYKIRYVQQASLWTPESRTTAGPEGGYFVEESQPRDVGAGLYEWDRTYAFVPDSHEEPESFVHNYQQVAGGTILEATIPVTSRIQYDYFYTEDFTTIEILRAYKLAVTNGVVYVRGTASEGEVIAEDSQVTRWKGNIFQRKTRYVPEDVFDAL